MTTLNAVRNEQSADTERLAGKLHAQLKFGRIEEILHDGLHDYLTQFFHRIAVLGQRVSRDFLVPLAAT